MPNRSKSRRSKSGTGKKKILTSSGRRSSHRSKPGAFEAKISNAQRRRNTATKAAVEKAEKEGEESFTKLQELFLSSAVQETLQALLDKVAKAEADIASAVGKQKGKNEWTSAKERMTELVQRGRAMVQKAEGGKRHAIVPLSKTLQKVKDAASYARTKAVAIRRHTGSAEDLKLLKEELVDAIANVGSETNKAAARAKKAKDDVAAQDDAKQASDFYKEAKGLVEWATKGHTSKDPNEVVQQAVENTLTLVGEATVALNSGDTPGIAEIAQAVKELAIEAREAAQDPASTSTTQANAAVVGQAADQLTAAAEEQAKENVPGNHNQAPVKKRDISDENPKATGKRKSSKRKSSKRRSANKSSSTPTRLKNGFVIGGFRPGASPVAPSFHPGRW